MVMDIATNKILKGLLVKSAQGIAVLSIGMISAQAQMMPRLGVVPHIIDMNSSEMSEVAPSPTPYKLFQSQNIIRKSNGNLAVFDPTYGSFKLTKAIDGVDLNWEKAAYLYEKRIPALTTFGKGMNYFIFKASDGLKAMTSKANGNLINVGKIYDEPETYGGVYFIAKGTRNITVVDSEGWYMPSFIPAPKLKVVDGVELAGGNFFIDEQNRLTVFKALSYDWTVNIYTPGKFPGIMFTHTDVNDTTGNTFLSFPNAIKVGGNYFLNQDGSINAISAENGGLSMSYYPCKDTVKDVPCDPFKSLGGNAVEGGSLDRPVVMSDTRKMGGNYFITESNVLHTIASNGYIYRKWQLPSRPVKSGYNYFVMADGSLYVIAADGYVLNQLVEVSTTGIQYTPFEKINLNTISTF